MTRTPFSKLAGQPNSRQIFVGRASVVDFDPRKEALEPPEVFPVHLSSQCPHGALEIHRQMVQKLFFSHINIVHSPGSRSRQELCMKTRLSLYYTGSNIIGIMWGAIHKPCGHGRGGGGFYQMSILIHMSYLVKWSTKGGEGQKCPKYSPHGLWTTLDGTFYVT